MNHSLAAFAFIISARRLTNTTARVEKKQAAPINRRNGTPARSKRKCWICDPDVFKIGQHISC